MSNLPTQYQEYIHLSRYSRWLPDKMRRETWSETVGRYFKFFEEHLKENFSYKIPPNLRKELEDAVLNLKIMPSMRCLMTAGPALKKENIAGYNCAYIPVDSIKSFDEILYVLMNGTGVGFSVERKHTEKLPQVPIELYPTETIIKVRDSKLGWAKAYRELLSLLCTGLIPSWDVSQVRAAGSVLKTFGGRASGPEPLVDLFKFTIEKFKGATGRKLRPLECHDIVCKVAECIVVGGVRRSALLSLSDLGDDELRNCKSGEFGYENSQRYLANNSANYHEKPDLGTFLKEWRSLYMSKSGERGIFSSLNAKKHTEKLGERRESLDDFGTNPCSEIILRSREFCNLTEAVIRSDDTWDDIETKVKLATILGTWQSTLTDFRYISNKWKINCEEERLLGVSLTGIMDNSLTNCKDLTSKKDVDNISLRLESLKEVAVNQNQWFSKRIGINPSAAITAVKPSGTVSQLVDSASGIHTRHSPYYIRTVRGDKKDPITKLMIDQGVPYEDDIIRPDVGVVFSFPMKSPKEALYRDDLSAIDQLIIHTVYSESYTEHKVSQTISVKEDEWLQVGAFVYEHFDAISGVSFLPYSDHVYKQAPYQDCTEKEYKSLLKKMPSIDWSKLSEYEKNDYTTSSQELSCSGGACEIV
ncbi:MAG: putative ribonucleoside-diphosphate reductase subunit alpha [Prokaryotic dsDNA virus sp.]|nr:MAG: putative ribonucleoside-diphosphate reductase subunit alpha [Prokaryotic dsDNA virus sp.]|tara:strand:- start:19858 stop:21789 length:1932 start_codon:yes stop_codon:yes gene_type:complete